MGNLCSQKVVAISKVDNDHNHPYLSIDDQADRLGNQSDDQINPTNIQTTSETEPTINSVDSMDRSRSEHDDQVDQPETHISISPTKSADQVVPDDPEEAIGQVVPDDPVPDDQVPDDQVPDDPVPDDPEGEVDLQIDSTKSNMIWRMMSAPKCVRIIFIGPHRSGKTCIRNVLVGQYYDDIYIPTESFECIGFNHAISNASDIGMSNDVQLWDLSGDPKYVNHIVKQCTFDCVCYVDQLDADQSAADQSDDPQKLYKNIISKYFDDVVEIFVHNKCDVPFKQIECLQGKDHYEMDCRNIDNCLDLISAIVQKVVEKKK
jgi:GTPase SAR1 family protein